MVKISRWYQYFLITVTALALSFTSAAAQTSAYNSNENAGKPIIRSIKVVGIHKLSESFIINAAGIKPGDIYTDEKAKSWKRKLEKLSAVEVAVVRAFPSEGGGVNLFIVISEEKTVHVIPLISRGLTNKWSYGASYTNTDFRGKNEQVKLKGMAGGTNFFEASWGKPAAFPLKMFGFEISAGYIDYSYPFRDFRSYMLNDRIKKVTSSIRLAVEPNDLLEVHSAVGVDIFDVDNPMLIGQGQGNIPDAPSGTYTTTDVGIKLSTLDRLSYPQHGFLVSISRKDWGVFQNDAKIKNFQYHFKGIGALRLEKSILAVAARSTITGGRIPLMLLQHIGGEGTIRGYEFGTLSGANSLFGKAELRFPLNFSNVSDYDNPIVLMDIHLFTDTGVCWNDGETLSMDDFLSGFGLGINLITSRSTVIMVDYAWTMNSHGRWQLDVRSSF